MAAKSQALKRFCSDVSFVFDTFLLRKIRPFMFILVIDDTCNLDCFYCTTKNTGMYDLEAANVLSALSEAYRRGHRALVITGGEPMLWRSGQSRLADVVTYARDVGFTDIAIFTNGTVPLAIENTTFIVSIEGTRDTHNAVRSGSYDRVLEHCRNTSSKLIATLTISKANVGELEAAVDQITAHRVFSHITFNILTHNPQIVAEFGIVGEERQLLLDRIWKLKQQGYPIILSRAAYKALRANNWKRPIPQIELFAGNRLFTCCRDVVNPDICRICGYSSCVEISQALALKPSAILQLMKTR